MTNTVVLLATSDDGQTQNSLNPGLKMTFNFHITSEWVLNNIPLKAKCWEKAQLLVWNLRGVTQPGCRQSEAERTVLIKPLCSSGPYGRTRAPQVASACVPRKAAAPAGSEHQEHVGQAAKRMETHSALLNDGWRGLKHLFFSCTEERFSVLIGGVRRARSLTKGGLREHHLLPFVSVV